MTDTETSETAGNDRVRRRPPTDLVALAAAFARARRAEMPAVAPRAFDAAVEALRSAAAAPAADRAASIAQAADALEEAEIRANRCADLVADVARRRVGTMYGDRTRFRAQVVIGSL